MNNIKEKIISILIPNAVGAISAILAKVSENIDKFNKPSFTPPSIVFPIVWTVLYVLMGISSYLIYKDDSPYKREALRIYAIQLIINGIWSIVFFRFKAFLLLKSNLFTAVQPANVSCIEVTLLKSQLDTSIASSK